jgi:hypothetical protein
MVLAGTVSAEMSWTKNMEGYRSAVSVTEGNDATPVMDGSPERRRFTTSMSVPPEFGKETLVNL